MAVQKKFKHHIYDGLSCGIVIIHGFDDHNNVPADLDAALKATLELPSVKDCCGRGMIMANLAGEQREWFSKPLEAIGFRKVSSFRNPRSHNINDTYVKVLTPP